MSEREGFKLPPMVTVADWLLLGSVLAVSALFYGFRMFAGPGDGALSTVIRVGEERVAELPTRVDTTLVVRGELGTIRVVQSGGEVWFSDSRCKLKICERMGHIGRAGQIIVCAPSRVMARLESAGGEPDDTGGLDAISR